VESLLRSHSQSGAAARVGPMLERPAGLLAACTVAPGSPAGAQSEPCRWLDSGAVYACVSRVVSEGYGDKAGEIDAHLYMNIYCAIVKGAGM